MNAYLGSIPATMAGCPTSRSFFASVDTAGLPSSLPRAPQLHRGAPCSQQRTWAENDGRSPPKLSFQDHMQCHLKRKRHGGSALGSIPATSRRAPSFAFFAKGGIRKSPPSAFRNSRT